MVISAQCQGLKIKDLLYSIFLIHSSLSTSPLNHQETEWRFEEGEEADKRSKTTSYNYLFCVAPCKLWPDIFLYRIIRMLFQIKKLSYCELLEKNKSSPRSYSFPVSSAHFMQVAEVHSCPFTCLFFFLCLVKLFPNQWLWCWTGNSIAVCAKWNSIIFVLYEDEPGEGDPGQQR